MIIIIIMIIGPELLLGAMLLSHPLSLWPWGSPRGLARSSAGLGMYVCIYIYIYIHTYITTYVDI